MSNNNFLIEDSDLDITKVYCECIENSELRNRSVANVLGATIAEKYFTDNEIDNKTGLYRISKILENIEISDIYINDCYIDVRLVFNENELCVPKSHFDRNILPVAYMFIKINEELSGGEVLGFVLAGAIDTTQEFDGYYPVAESDLVSFYDIEPHLVKEYNSDIDEDFEIAVYDFLDGRLDDLNSFLRTLLSSDEAREILYKAAKAQTIFNLISVNKKTGSTELQDTVLEQEEISENNDEALDLALDTDVEETSLLEEQEEVLLEDNEVESLDTDDTEMLVENDSNDEFDMTIEEEQSFEINEDSTTELISFSDDNNEISLELDTDIEADTIEETFENVEMESMSFEEGSLIEADDATDFSLQNEEEFSSENISFSEDVSMLETSDSIEENEDVTIETNIPEVEENFEPVDTETLALEEKEEEISIKNEVSFEDDVETLAEDTLAEIEDKDETETIVEPSESNEVENNIVDEDLELNEFLEDLEQENQTEQETEQVAEFSTVTTPSINDIEDVPAEELNEEQLEDNTPVAVETEETEEDKAPQIDALFAQEDIDNEDEYSTAPQGKQKSGGAIKFIGLVALLGALGYFGYTKFAQQNLNEPPKVEKPTAVINNNKPVAPQKDAMPVETVENIKIPKPVNEGTSVSIPAIEQNLGASITVSNLAVSWEVPAGYVNNSIAKKYFTKMGKIIQLRLKTELLLLSKPPISNEIAVELEFNKPTQKFAVKSILKSSGEKAVDDVVKSTVAGALNLRLNMNTSSFENVSGNPVLLIRL